MANNSYQNSYQRVSIKDEQEHQNVNERGSDDNNRKKRFIQTIAIVVVVVLALWWGLTKKSSTSTAKEGTATTASSSSVSSCGPSSVIVDTRGVIEDGPGSDGICDDPAKWYDDQLVDHFSDDRSANNKWTQKYFVNDEYFQGPGHPIFYIMGGEDDANCLFYPFVTHNLARIFGGLTLEAEHRFYGKSQPVDPLHDVQDMVGLLTPDQAMMDYLRLRKSLSVSG